MVGLIRLCTIDDGDDLIDGVRHDGGAIVLGTCMCVGGDGNDDGSVGGATGGGIEGDVDGAGRGGDGGGEGGDGCVDRVGAGGSEGVVSSAGGGNI